ncbi:zinc-binding dehydrogenase [Streptomyces sp. NPDC054796]
MPYSPPRAPGARTRERLGLPRPGVLSFALESTPHEPPGPGEVGIRVHAAGLNFTDVLTAMGLSGTFYDHVPPLGLECAGVVTGTGPGVPGVKAGDRVAAVVEDAFASQVNAPASAVVPLPDQMDFAQGATLPVAYLTAWYGLSHLARLRPGERVLVHSAAGGVGSAATAVAAFRGAELLATAGTPEKRRHLSELGIRHVMDSRDGTFGQETLRATGGEGVDVVLNSLPGDAIRTGLELLRVRGRFVEIGKRDIMADAPLGMLPFQRGISMHSLDLRLLMTECPELIGSLLDELAPLFASGELAPLPCSPFPVKDAAAAFRRMSGGRHIGKTVLTFA